MTGIKGLSETEVRDSRIKYGDNSLAKEKTKGFFRRFFDNLNDPIIRVLIFVVAVEIAFTLGRCNWLEIGGIITAVLIAATVSTVSEFGSEKAFSKMQTESVCETAVVIRDGKRSSVLIRDIVVGDIIELKAGDIIPADGRIISGKLMVDQSALNGESIEVAKYPKDSFSFDLSSPSAVFRGTTVCDGYALIEAERIGSGTYYGEVAKDVQVQTRISPLKLRLERLARTISRIGYVTAFLVGITYLFFAFLKGNGFDGEKIIASIKDAPFVISTLSHAITLMITVIVVAVPEGLPMMITVVLSANMRRMLEDKIVVKKLVGIETAGSMNILFTDKTGTLTGGKSSVERIITADNTYSKPASLRSCGRLYDYIKASATLGASVNGGNSTDKALRTFFSTESASEFSVKSETPFSSERKYSALVLGDGATVIRGAPEIILKSCDGVMGKNGEKCAMARDVLNSRYLEEAKRGGRVIAIAVKFAEGESLFLAFAVMRDKLRFGVGNSVSAIKRAGVSVVMITGDGRETATAIARECGIVSSDKDLIITRDELQKMNDNDVKKIIPRLRVLARALPSDKTRLVRLSQELGLVVGMTGDGINDAPSLKLADVGFAMGSGTEIAKAASDIVIIDDSFEAIVKTVLYGRTIFKSIRKFIAFQLMMNLTACGVSLIGQFIGFENPITIIQMLWINIIMDTLGGLAFAGEPPLEYYMLEKPKSREEPILSRDMLHSIIITGGYTLFICIMFMGVAFFRSLFRQSNDNLYFLTGFYALFVFSGIFNCFNARSERMNLLSNICKNKLFVIIMVLITVIQLVMVYFGGEVFRCAPLTFREMLNVILLSASVIPFDGVRRIFKKLSSKSIEKC